MEEETREHRTVGFGKEKRLSLRRQEFQAGDGKDTQNQNQTATMRVTRAESHTLGRGSPNCSCSGSDPFPEYAEHRSPRRNRTWPQLCRKTRDTEKGTELSLERAREPTSLEH